MAIFCIDNTALDFWKSPKSLSLDSRARRFQTSPFEKPDKACAKRVLQTFSQPPFSVLVPRDNRAYDSGVFHCLTHVGEPPYGAFVKVTKDLYVATPEYLFVRQARMVDFLALVIFGYELCGTYAFVLDGQRGKPLTSTASIKKFLRGCDGETGVKKASRVINYVIDASASPRETSLAMKLTLPHTEGGYELPRPVLNKEFHLEPAHRVLLGKETLRTDFFWEHAHLAMEYDSDQWHTGANRLAADSKRRNILNSMGINVVTVTNDEMKSVAAMDNIVAMVAHVLGVRQRTTVANFDELKLELRDILEC